MSAKDMTCVTCGKVRAYPDGFPSPAFAVCWRCTWNEHIHSQHPRDVRRIRKVARKRAERLTERDIRDRMFGDELDQAIGVAAAQAHRLADSTATPPTTRTDEESQR